MRRVYLKLHLLIDRRVYLRLHLLIDDQATHQRKNLKLPSLHCYSRNISEIWRVEN